MSLLVVLLAGVLAQDECANSAADCLHAVDPTFAALYDSTDGAGEGQSGLCNMAMWMQRSEACGTCLHDIELTSGVEQQYLGRRLCLTEAAAPSLQVTSIHPLAGQVVRLVVQQDCTWGADLPTDAVGVVSDACGGVAQQFADMASSGLSIGIAVLRSGWADDPSRAPIHEGADNIAGFTVYDTVELPLLDILASAEPVYGRVRYNCREGTNWGGHQADVSDYGGDMCPGHMVSTACTAMQDPAQRLCQDCPLRVVHTALGEGVCLYAPDLTPTRRHHLLSSNLPTAPYSALLLYTTRELCKAASFDPAWKGRIIVVSAVAVGCPPADILISAYEAGVLGVVVLADRRVQCVGRNVLIPSASTTSPEERTQLLSFMRGGTLLGEDVWERGAVLAVPEVSEEASQTTPPVEVVAVWREEDDGGLGGGGVAAAVVAGLLVVVVVGVQVACMRQTPEGPTGVSLGTASTALSMSVAVLLTVVTFLLTYCAGVQGVDTAGDAAEAAVQQTADLYVQDVQHLSNSILVQTLTTARDAFVATVHSGENTLLEGILLSPIADNDIHIKVQEYTHPHGIRAQWRWALYMPNAYMDSFHYYSVDGELRFGANHSLSVAYPREHYDPTLRLLFSDTPLGGMRAGYRSLVSFSGLGLGAHAFLVGSYQVPPPTEGNCGPLIAYVREVPRATHDAYYLSALPAVDYSKVVQRALGDVQGRITENMTFCFFEGDVVFAVTPGLGDLYREIDYFGQAEGSAGLSETQRVGSALLTLNNTPHAHFNALGNILKGHSRTALVAGVTELFDQRAHHKGSDSTLLYLSMDRSVEERSGNMWDTAVLCASGGKACYSFGNGHVGASISLDGSGAVVVLPFLTQRTPRVAATRNGNAAFWNSTTQHYRHTAPVHGIPDVIVTPTGSPVHRDRFHRMQEHAVTMWVKPKHSAGTDNTAAFLFMDAQEGAGYQLTGKAALVIDASQDGCRTQPLPGGLPSGEWTHVTAVASYAQKRLFCAVYLNGTLHSRADMAEGVSMQYVMGNYTLGYGFAGEMDEVRFHNRTLCAADAASMMARGEPAPVESKLFSATARGIAGTSGFISKVYALAVPNEDIVRDAKAAVDVVKWNLRIDRTDTNNTLERKVAETCFIVIVVLLLSALVLLTYNHMLAQSLALFAIELDAAAHINMDDLSPIERTSVLLEVNVMNRAVALLVRNMKAYKSFMPLSMQQSVIPQTRSLSDAADAGGAAVTSIHSEESFAVRSCRAQGVGLLAAGLPRRKMAFLVTNVQGFLRTLNGAAEMEVVERHREYIQHCLDCAQTRCGVPETFSGDRVFVTFNGAKPCTAYAEAAADVALQIRDQWPNLGDGVTMALAAGSVRAGHLGVDAMRRYTMLGSTVTWVHALERYCAVNGHKVMADAGFAEQAKGFEHRHYSAVTCRKYGARHVIITTVLQSRGGTSAGEWMYEAASEKGTGNAAWNSFFEAVVRGWWQEATTYNETKADMHVTSNDCYGVLEHALRERSFTPTHIEYLC